MSEKEPDPNILYYGPRQHPIDNYYSDTATDFRTSYRVDILCLDRPARPPWRRLVLPVQVCVRDDLIRRRCPPRRVVLRRVGVADKVHVVTPDERAVER